MCRTFVWGALNVYCRRRLSYHKIIIIIIITRCLWMNSLAGDRVALPAPQTSCECWKWLLLYDITQIQIGLDECGNMHGGGGGNGDHLYLSYNLHHSAAIRWFLLRQISRILKGGQFTIAATAHSAGIVFKLAFLGGSKTHGYSVANYSIEWSLIIAFSDFFCQNRVQNISFLLNPLVSIQTLHRWIARVKKYVQKIIRERSLLPPPDGFRSY